MNSSHPIRRELLRMFLPGNDQFVKNLVLVGLTAFGVLGIVRVVAAQEKLAPTPRE